MTALNALPWLAVVATAVALMATVAPTRRLPAVAAAAPRLTTLAAAVAGTAWLALLLQFLLGNMAMQAVWIYASQDLAVWYRFAASWAGREGSLLLWATSLAVGTAWVARRADAADRVPGGAPAPSPHLAAWLLAWQLAFWLVVARQDSFAATAAHLVQAKPMGNGLNPTLRTPFMLIHPPIQFVAYALATVPAAAALAAWSSGRRDLLVHRVVVAASRIGLLAATAGLVLGGVWAYYTLGFGGYWAWDPVEVANLLPWVAWVIWAHAGLALARRGDLPGAAPLLAGLPLALTLVSTLATRTGLWVSVHAFTDPTNAFNPDAAGRFLDILDASPGLAPYLGLTLAAFLAPLAAWATRQARHAAATGPRVALSIAAGGLAAATVAALLSPTAALSWWFQAAHALPVPMPAGLVLVAVTALAAAGWPLLVADDAPALGRRDWLRDRGLLVVAVGLLGLGLLVVTVLFFQSVNGWDRAAYDARTPFLLVPLLAAITIMQARGVVGTRRALAVAGLGLIMAGGAAAAFPANRGGAAILAAGAIALLVGVARMAITIPGTPRRRQAFTLAWLAAALDLAWWLSPPSWLPGWPTQLVFGAAAAWALWHLHLAAANPAVDPRPALLVAGLLGGFLVAPLLAVAAAWLWRRDQANGSGPPRRAVVRPAAVHGVHVALVLLVMGYAASTWWVEEGREVLTPDAAMVVGDAELALAGSHFVNEPATPWTDTLFVDIAGPGGTASPLLYWEPTSASHYPLPATTRSWWRDMYYDVDAVCIDAAAAADDNATEADDVCAADGWVTAYEPSRRLASPDVVAVRLHALSLPGIGAVWAGSALLVLYAGLITRHGQSGTQRP